ncbi:enoyl-ACP reductase FabV [Litoribrevibacter albus]|uniref:trans-2-enoyl-CoA reductase (NAD(+)) n=1 Tax=Litoribrevibacter albus TaxID=1473156 RepID=A0AA37S8U8_9GAMM|nr:enoyl-ACP reductase FabV [Litoribrevibacter albus]GLQ30698.1 enoyl-[acyl-carrier-protein] reductase [NADH] [Litoribrevibacter albus]
MMVVEPKIRGFMCTTAHPQGCKTNIESQINQVRAWAEKQDLSNKPKRVLIIGGSAGYGLSSRILCAAGYGATTLSVSMEKAPKANKTGTAGWYNNHFLEEWIRDQGMDSYSLFGDAFSGEVKQQVVDKIRDTVGQVDLVVYSLAAPRRIKQEKGEPVTYQSVIKPIGQTIDVRTVDTASGQMKTFELESATEQEIQNTVAVMGGEDWFDWMSLLNAEGLLSDQIQTVAFSYLGGELTKAIYGAATLGAAKEDVERYCLRINHLLNADVKSPMAKVAVLKAIVTQSSAAIPSLPLYISVLYRVMKAQGNHEGCLDQILRLFETGLYPGSGKTCAQDKPYRYRLDDKELLPEVQTEVTKLWQSVSESNLGSVTDFEGYRSDFLKLFGFDWPEVDYQQDVSTVPS